MLWGFLFSNFLIFIIKPRIMALVKRLVKGSPLTYAEADGNLTYLDNKVTGSVGLIPVFDSVNTVTGSSILSLTGNNVTIDGSLTVTGDLTAMQYIISSSVTHFTESFSSGSTSFGDSLNDTHKFTGSVLITGSSEVIGTQRITGSLNISGSTFHNGFLSSSDGAYFSNQITVTHMTIGHGPTENNTNTAIGWLTMPVLASGLRNTIVGASSGFFLQSGSDNTVLGNNALVSLVSGSANTAIGQNAGFYASGSGNVFIGHQAGQLQTSGDNKLWIANSSTLTPLIKGDFAAGLLQFYTTGSTQITGSLIVSNAVTASYFTGDGSKITNVTASALSTPMSLIATSLATASVSDSASNIFTVKYNGYTAANIDASLGNTSFGLNALNPTTSGISNIAIGESALLNNTTGNGNTAIGKSALNSNTTGISNTATGNGALYYNLTGSFNTAHGYEALTTNRTGANLTAVGYQAAYSNYDGIFNTAIGYQAGYYTAAGNNNTSTGFRSLFFNTSGTDNAAFGLRALYSNTTGIQNTGIGVDAGRTNSTGTANVFVGFNAGYSEAGSNKLYIANNSGSTPLIKGDFSTGLLQFNTAAGTKITGSLTVTGSSVFSGSATGLVNSLSITSNTASLDLTRGNFFTLQLVGAADTYINPSNIQSGQTICVLISTVGSGTVSFPANVFQASDSPYTPTTTTGKDIITLVSFDTSNLYLVNVKNLI